MKRFQQILQGEAVWTPSADPALKAALAQAGVLSGAVFPTSGSTGDPKFVQLSLEAMRVSATAVIDWLELTREDAFLLVLPDFHVGGFMLCLRAAMVGGRWVELTGKWDPIRCLDLIEESNISVTSLVPTQLSDLVATGRRAPDCLRAVVLGGAALSDELAEAAARAGWPVLASFGMSETASQIATQPLSEAGKPRLPQVLPHVELSVDVSGRLSIESPCLFDGYWTCSEGSWSFEKRLNGPWLSSDLVELSGDRLRPMGRADQIIKILGEQVNLDPINDDLKRLVAETFCSNSGPAFLVVALPDERSGARLVLAGEASIESLESLRHGLNERLPNYSRIGAVFSFERLPRSALGKVRLGELKNRCLERELGA